ncbi:MAG TPA: acyl-CoA thioesterase II [Steroidobacteraceae bacterium]|nr:acyl-CoA thioesterase II [Steroidobacteraceae bacterium]
MDARLAELLRLLRLERLENDLFRGASNDIGAPQVFGGQVLGQALRAAYATLDSEHHAHSLHAYFLKRGDCEAPIVYFVDRSRDGHSFSNRRVTAIQHGEQIFHMAASFQLPQPGVEHQLPMPAVPPPEALASGALPTQAELSVMPEKMREYYRRERPFEFRLVPEPADAGGAGAGFQTDTTGQQVWVRAVDHLPDDDALHRCLLAYASDFHLLRTATRPHARLFASGRRFLASIDHAMWFHWPVRVDEWFLYATDSPSASGARGFARGSIFARDGRLVASTAQEGLMRVSA